ncbi:hypothetical protein CAPTEDRAFT_183790 [Capitella teleta]|uniref:Actin-related protein 6 n=1 Tax=Capitella teleta TaxID=283909 RepID=R7UZH5_CAPTE|nr:hypothetical protein CAPTEDRAFT_183790 [Capitella teleta]|eukprot:ELU11988.1 hypothetical protein CAPTEDRAFT_183790 [Capitella teleta]
MASATVVLDNGAYCAKIGTAEDSEPKLVPNCVVKAKNVRNRVFIGDQVEECKDLSGLYYLLPFQKGYLVNWEIERQVWDHMFGKDGLQVDFGDTNLVVTEPYFNFSAIRESFYEVLFEEYQFKSVFSANPSFLCQYKNSKLYPEDALCTLVIDSGYSFTYIVPYHKENIVREGMKRINIGGKVLTNHLKEVISYRQLMVMDETYVINQLKEDVCYVADDFYKHMEIAKHRGKENTVCQEYVLPDYTQVKRGHVRSENQPITGSEQIIRMNNERFAIPEALFHPSDVGVQEMGIAESVVHAISCTPEKMHAHLYKNIVLSGGNCVLPGFENRIYSEIRSMAPSMFDVKIRKSKNPVTLPWEGGVEIAKDPTFSERVISQAQYNEGGLAYCMEHFTV